MAKFHLVPRLNMLGTEGLPSTPPYVFMAWYLIKYVENFAIEE
jgi:hypothetical protein